MILVALNNLYFVLCYRINSYREQLGELLVVEKQISLPLLESNDIVQAICFRQSFSYKQARFIKGLINLVIRKSDSVKRNEHHG